MATLVLAPGDSIVPVFTSVARTADTTSDDFVVGRAGGLLLAIDATAIAATPSVVFTIQGVDIRPATPKVYTVLASAAVVAVSTVFLRVSPHLTAAANTIAKDIVPPVFRVFADHVDADSITYTVTAYLTL